MARKRRFSRTRSVVSRVRHSRHSRGTGMLGNLAGAGIAVAARKYAVPMLPSVIGAYTPLAADVGIMALGQFAVKGSVGKGMVLGGATIAFLDGMTLFMGGMGATSTAGAGEI